MKELGDYLKELRNNKSMSIRQASEGIGISHTYLDSLEKGYDPRTMKERKPTPDVLRKISKYYDVQYMDLFVAAGYYTKEEAQYKKEVEAWFDAMTPEEYEEYIKEDLKSSMRIMNIIEYEKKVHVRIEDFLNNKYRNFYINNHKLNDEDIKILIALYKDRENNYPTDTQIEKEYEVIKKELEENKKKVDSGEAFQILHPYDDIDTNEDV